MGYGAHPLRTVIQSEAVARCGLRPSGVSGLRDSRFTQRTGRMSGWAKDPEATECLLEDAGLAGSVALPPRDPSVRAALRTFTALDDIFIGGRQSAKDTIGK
jgi:hypothetical protein